MPKSSVLIPLPDEFNLRSVAAASLTAAVFSAMQAGNSEKDALLHVNDVYLSILRAGEACDDAAGLRKWESLVDD